jgi:hypothetical protein
MFESMRNAGTPTAALRALSANPGLPSRCANKGLSILRTMTT